MTTSENMSWRRLAVLPLLLLLVGVVVLNLAGWLIDSSSLDQGEDSWGYVFGAVFLSLYALPVVIVAAGCALVGWLSTDRAVAGTFAWVGAVVCAVPAAFLATVALGSVSGPSAEVVFGLVSCAIGLVLLAPVALCTRQSLRHRS